MSDLNGVIIEASRAFAMKFQEGTEAGKPLFHQVAMDAPSSSKATGYGWLEHFPTLKEWMGDRMLKELAKHTYKIENKKYESSIKVPRVDFEDNDYGQYAPLFKEMGQCAQEYPDELVFTLLKEGFNETCFDGQYFFDTDHPVGDKTVSNAYGVEENNAPWFLLDTTRTMKPLIWQERTKPELQGLHDNKNPLAMDSHLFLKDEFLYGVRARGNAGFSFWQLAAGSKQELNAANFETMYNNMIKQRSDSGGLLRIRPSLLVVPTSLRAAAHSIIKREFLKEGEENINYKLVDILVCPWLDE